MMLKLKYLPGQKSASLKLECRAWVWVAQQESSNCYNSWVQDKPAFGVCLVQVLPNSGYSLLSSLLLVPFCVFTYFKVSLGWMSFEVWPLQSSGWLKFTGFSQGLETAWFESQECGDPLPNQGSWTSSTGLTVQRGLWRQPCHSAGGHQHVYL